VNRIVYLMRGLPSCGKSHTARRLAGEQGIICETDQFFYSQVGENPSSFDYDANLWEDARRWNFQRFSDAVDAGVETIVVDRGNGLNVESQVYARYAVEHGYRVELKEPESDWWQELRVLLKYRKFVDSSLFDQWADALAQKSQQTHRVPASRIRRWMGKWKYDLTVQEILDLQ